MADDSPEKGTTSSETTTGGPLAGIGAAGPSMLHGRRTIVTDEDAGTAASVVKVLQETAVDHAANRGEIDYLWRYYKGCQPILAREKQVRPEINNKVVENRAREITMFSLGYLIGEPVKNTSRKKDDATSKKVELLNELLESEGKEAVDRDAVKWGMVGGVGVKMALPDRAGETDEAPFELFSLDPRLSYVVYSNDYRREPLMGVTMRELPSGARYSVYTRDRYYEVDSNAWRVVADEANPLKRVPIFEFPLNDERMGCFEPVLPLLDAINAVDSNRLDGIEQFVQSFIKFTNCDVDEETFAAMKELGAIKVKSSGNDKADVEIMTSELDQSQTQVLKNDLYQAVLEICGMPNRNGGSSTSDTGAAVILRDGWSTAESHAKDREAMFKRSELEFLKLVLSICRAKGVLDLGYNEIDMTFTRRNYEAIQSKSQVLCQMLGSGGIHPRLAFEHCGMFSDPENAYAQSASYVEERALKAAALAADGGDSTDNLSDDKDGE